MTTGFRTTQIRTIRQVAALVLLVLGGAGGWYWWSIAREGLVGSVERLQAQNTSLQQANQTTRRAVVDLGANGIREAIDAYTRQEQMLRGLVPPEDTVSRLMSLITSSAAQNGLRLGEFSRLKRAEVGGFAANGFSLKVTGRYHDVGRYLTSLLSGDRITQISHVEVRAVAPTGGTGDSTAVVTDLKSVLAGGAAGTNWQSEARFQIVELGVARQPLPSDSARVADSLRTAGTNRSVAGRAASAIFPRKTGDATAPAGAATPGTPPASTTKP